jgi:hypothetical protein
MKRSSNARAVAVAAFAAAAGLACAAGRAPAPLDVAVLDSRGAARPPLPDDTERAAGRVAALALADLSDAAAEALGALVTHEQAREAAGEPPTGLTDDAHDVVNAMAGERGYEPLARELLDSGDPDPELERRIRAWLDARPLELAERRIAEDRKRKLAAVVNRLVAPLSRLVLGGALNPIESGRAAVATMLVTRDFPDATPHERAALRAWEEFLARNPDAPEAPEVAASVEHYREKRRREVHGDALHAGERALGAGRPDFALVHLERAERTLASDRDTAALRRRAEHAIATRERNLERSLGADSFLGVPLDEERRRAFGDLARAAIGRGLGEVATRSSEWALRFPPDVLSDEIDFLKTFGPLSRGDEDAYFALQRALANGDPAKSNMARHAAREAFDPERNPWDALRATRSAATRERWLTIVLGSRRNGPPRRNLWRPLEWLIDVPGLAATLVTFPLRLVGAPFTGDRFSGPVIHAGERYLARFPHGMHSQTVHRVLEKLQAERGVWSEAAEHQRARVDGDPATLARYRTATAERALESARSQRAFEVRVSLYRMIADEYRDTPQAATARAELRTLLSEFTPQKIRVSRAFLEEHPALSGPDALGLRRELFDGDHENGELAEDGVTLLGDNVVRVALVRAEPVVERIPRERFARLVSLLEEEAYERLLADARESPEPDPQRDAFFADARLGLSGGGARPSAVSESVYLGTREKFGLVKRKDSILPVELVLQGGLEDLGFAAFPRIIAPKDLPDAFLYE